ncbi:MAG: hypothetical protein ABSH50_25010 [Bryobacteraceae bacterium]|jgi:hypothetical protein
MACAICRIRKPRRFCPGVQGDICTLCCGNEREVTVSCPLDCQYLQEARKHERSGPVDANEVPNKDVRVTEEFLEEHLELLTVVGRGIAKSALNTSGAVDRDVRDALEALIRTHRSLQSGVYYETRPENALARPIFDFTGEVLEEFHKREQEKLGMAHTRDADVLGVLVFLQRLEWDRNNGRARGRAFIDFLRGSFAAEPDAPAAESESPILL